VKCAQVNILSVLRAEAGFASDCTNQTRLTTLEQPFVTNRKGTGNVEMALYKHRSLAFCRRAFLLVGLTGSTDPCGGLVRICTVQPP
jgi:hypothetical protein